MQIWDTLSCYIDTYKGARKNNQCWSKRKAWIALLIWIQSRQQFVKEVDFRHVDISQVVIDDEEFQEISSELIEEVNTK
jgi:hypothetical protein